ncbi:ribonuclease Y [mine drainage metagenome]|uniref:Ribonuclease Y n=1 Tax=mine drainage metagenome TaxID=410659 RepID=A0A1J5TCF9_9ZZZZ
MEVVGPKECVTVQADDKKDRPEFPVDFYAHSAENEQHHRLPAQSGKWQLLRSHLEEVAKIAAEFAAPFGAADEARLAGLLHDLGKYQPGFQQYLQRGSPRTPHAIHGAAVLKRFPHVANVIAGHHAGLQNFDSEFTEKLNDLGSSPPGRALLESLVAAFRSDGLALPPKPNSPPFPERGDAAEDLRVRLLLSALADADYLDTERHFLRAAGKVRPEPVHASLAELLAKLNDRLKRFSDTNTTSLGRLRTRISAHCAAVGRSSAPGAYSLTVPTGGGKTLASAAFALHHAAARGFERVVYVIPYTSIIEQNARVFASVFGEENILEHHSLADWQTGDESEEAPDVRAERNKLAAENWDAPFILTTNVQFFESLHSHRPSAVRKLHRLLGAVVIFDECQTFPPELLDPSLATLQALQSYGKTSFVFCTATQPAFERREFFPAGFPSLSEIIPPDETWRLHERPEFRRTRIRYSDTSIDLEEFSRRVAACDRALAVVNTRRAARELFDAVHRLGADANIFHLSTYMCPAHRQTVFNEIRRRLVSPGESCLVVSTQLIEAGVDLDFPKVFRVLGPLDSILQAAGRCNREGMLSDSAGRRCLGEVEVITLADAPLPPGIYKRATALASKFLPSGEGGEIPPDAIQRYFRELYHDTERDKYGIAHLRAQRLHRTLGTTYRWIDEDEPTESVLTDYSEEGRRWIAALEDQGYEPPSRQQRRAIERQSLNLRASEVLKGERSGILRKLQCGVTVTQHSYDDRFGYDPNGVLSGKHTIF